MQLNLGLLITVLLPAPKVSTNLEPTSFLVCHKAVKQLTIIRHLIGPGNLKHAMCLYRTRSFYCRM